MQTRTREEWEINPDEVQIAKTADGRDHFLGGGGFGMVRALPSLSWPFQHHLACPVAHLSLPMLLHVSHYGAHQLHSMIRSVPGHSTSGSNKVEQYATTLGMSSASALSVGQLGIVAGL